MAYTKLDRGITESTIWQAPDTTRLVWIALLARADENGYVGASMPGLASLARVSLEACIAAVETLEAPDKWSRTKEHEGRRIAPADGGWVLLNHAKYRAMQSADDRRERSRIAMAALRAGRKQLAQVNNGDQSCSALSQEEEQAEEEAKAGKAKHTPPAEATAQAPATPPAEAKPKRQKQHACAIQCPDGVDAQTWADWLDLRKAKRAPVTQTVLDGAHGEAQKAGMTLEAFLRIWCRRGSQGLEAAWLKPEERQGGGSGRSHDRVARQLETAAEMLGVSRREKQDEYVDVFVQRIS